MRVICISTPNSIAEGVSERPIVKVGEAYTVIDSGDGESLGQAYPWYELKEHFGFCYAQRLFIPLSSIDETEMERNYNKVMA